MNRSWFYRRLVLAICVLVFFSVATAGSQYLAFVAIGDMGCDCSAQRKIASRMIEWHKEHPYDTVITVGDNIYGKGKKRGGHRDLFPDRFDKYYKPLLDQGVKFYASLGNHDLETARGIHEILDKNRFHILRKEGYYSFTSNIQVDGKTLVAFFTLNSEPLLSKDGDPAQEAWLGRELRESKAVWKIVFFHRPIYAPRGRHEPELIFRKRIEPILETNGVRLVLQGHDHFYARMKPINGITYIVAGGGGKDLHTPKKDPFTAITAKANHFFYAEVFPDRIDFWAIPATGAPIDSSNIHLN